MTATLTHEPGALDSESSPPTSDQPRWGRPALGGLLLGTAVLYLWSLGESGWANSFYSAAAQAGSESWKAFFFGASDAAASITVDKTPLSLWVMGLSVRVFGLSSWSILVPQALMGVAAVGLLFASVRRTTGSYGTGLLAGAVLATTPVAALMFRFNNPDALLVLLLIGAAYGTLRAVESASPETARKALRWLVLAGALVGFAFLTKMMQAFLVLPAFALVYAVEARLGWGKKVLHLLAAFAAMIVSAGWWIAAVEFWPGDRPYIGGSQNNSILELTLGYNGLGRLTGEEIGSVGGGAGGAGGGGWGETGLLRMFNSEVGGQIAWLLPVALLLLAVGLALRGRSPRGDRDRAALIVWGGWLVVTMLTFSLMAGIFHAYYTVALAPAIAAVLALGARLLWQRREDPLFAILSGVVISAGTATAFMLLARTPDFLPWLRWVVVALGLVAAVGVAAGPFVGEPLRRLVAAMAVLALLAGPFTYSVNTATAAHTGSIPSAGPATGAGFGPGGRGMPGGMPGGTPGGMPGGFPGGAPPAGAPGQTGQTGGAGGVGGLLNGSTASAEMVALLTANSSDYTWVAATVGANSAAGFQLATELSVMPIGGFNGSDPSPTLAEFQEYVRAGQIHYFIGGGGGMGGGPGGTGGTGSSTGSDISTWVAENFTAQTVDGVTVYDLTTPASGSGGSL